MATARAIVVDDTDPRITYTGSWFQDNGTQDQIGNYGPTLMNTLHGTNTNSSFSFSFKGTSVRILGTNPTKNGDNIGPSWDCYVDGLKIGSSAPTMDRRNNLVLCQSGSLSSGQHQITLNVNTQGQTFWLDSIQVVPGDADTYDTGVSLIENTDQALEWSAGWTATPGDATAKLTRIPNSSVRLNFTGTSVTWMSRTSSGVPPSAGTASYTIDGGDQVPFNVPCVLQNATGDLFNQPCFTTPQLSPGAHNLVVTYHGGNTPAPLNLDYLLVANSTLSHDFTPPPIYAASRASDIVPNWKTILISSIVGGVAGVTILFGLVAALFLFCRRRQMRLKSVKKLSIVSAHNPSILEPVTTLPTTYRNPYSVLPASHHLRPPSAVAHSRPLSLCSEAGSLRATYGGSTRGRNRERRTGRLFTTNPSRLSSSTCSDYVMISPVTKDREASCYLQPPPEMSRSRPPSSSYPEAGPSHNAADYSTSITEPNRARTASRLYITNSNRLSTVTSSDHGVAASGSLEKDEEARGHEQTAPRNSADIVPIYGSGGWVLLHWTQTQTY